MNQTRYLPIDYRPRRTMLYVPAHIDRHLNKARLLDADSIIFDQQESVPPELKDEARQKLTKALQDPDFGHSEKLIRINPLESPWGLEDLKAAIHLPIDGLVFPRVESQEQLNEIIYHLDQMTKKPLRIIINIESPLGVLNSKAIAAHSRLDAIIMGTTDLANELKLAPTPDRGGLLTSLSMVILAARAFKKSIIDGPHFDLKDIEACEFSCRQARDLGFDGKTIIHPIQLNYTNDAFTPKRDEIQKAQRILNAIEEANKQGRSMAVLDDRLVEPVLAEWAHRIIAVYERVHSIGQSELTGIHPSK